MFLEINPHNIDQRLIKQAVEVLRKGKLIIFPTDTVYAVGCNAFNKQALHELARFKGIKLNKARFSLICSDLTTLSQYVRQLDRPIFKLLKRNLPGPFTFILEANNEIPKLFDSSRREIGIRIPDNPITLALIEELGYPLASTSLHDEEDQIKDYFIDPYQIYERYNDQTELIIDGGLGLLHASTVVDCTGSQPEIIRQGTGILDA